MNIFVGCGSRIPKSEEYCSLAEEIGRAIVEKKDNFVFGAYNHGLMGIIYQIVEKSKNSSVIAVTCKAYEEDLKELSYMEPAYIKDNISGRKETFYKVSDVLVYIPGGLGTLDELMSAIETKRGEEHNLPIIIVNQNGYFNNFLNMLEKAYTEEFSSDSARRLYKVVNNSKELFEEIEKLRKG